MEPVRVTESNCVDNLRRRSQLSAQEADEEAKELSVSVAHIS